MSRIYFAILLFVVSASAAEDDCNCENLADDEKLWKFLKQLSIDVPEKERSIYSVLPGVLSPLVSCDCEENLREKRKVDSKEIYVPESVEDDDEDLKAKLELLRPNAHSKNCPRGYRRFGFICVLEQALLE